ncbi:MAG: hypothetical protein EZS28_038234 [Streblomastix strix]|uniref:Uncharacterized protein n=1 Tax=Streblomastix strix TaxID=222440 RepID=A0A5J4U7B2_9EUKA|nr:MAG: hypothetical protein EZS28_038234 [Streblomastix strix]
MNFFFLSAQLHYLVLQPIMNCPKQYGSKIMQPLSGNAQIQMSPLCLCQQFLNPASIISMKSDKQKSIDPKMPMFLHFWHRSGLWDGWEMNEVTTMH